MDTMAQNWFLVQVKPNSHNIAKRNLQRQGFEVFCPKQKVTQRRSGRFVEVEQLLFPGYIFVGLDPEEAPWRAINGTFGVNRLVSFTNRRPAQVPTTLILALLSRCDGDNVVTTPLEFAKGDKVKFKTGPFADFVVSIETIDADQRVWVLIDLMGQELRMSAAKTQLRVA